MEPGRDNLIDSVYRVLPDKFGRLHDHGGGQPTEDDSQRDGQIQQKGYDPARDTIPVEYQSVNPPSGRLAMMSTSLP